MANYATIKAEVDLNIKANGNEEITGPILNGVLKDMITALGNGYLYKGIATPATSPGTPDTNVFYIATIPGEYANFGLRLEDGEVAILSYNGSWSKAVAGVINKIQFNGDSVYYGKELNLDGLPHVYNGYQIKVPANGTALASATRAPGANYRNARVPVEGAARVTYNSYTSTAGYGSLFVDENDIVVGGHAKTSSESNPITLQVPATAKYFIFGYTLGNQQTFNHVTVYYEPAGIDTPQIADDAVTTPKIADDAVTGSKLAEGAAAKNLSGAVGKYYSYNRMDSSKLTHGYIIYTTGAFYALPAGSSTNVFATDFIPVSQKGLYCYCRASVGNNGDGAVYDANKNYIRSLRSATYNYVDGDAFVRWTIKTDLVQQYILELPYFSITGAFSPQYEEQDIQKFNISQQIAKENVPEYLPALTATGGGRVTRYLATMAAGVNAAVLGSPYYLKRRGTVTLEANITTVGEIRVGFGASDSTGTYVKITSTDVAICRGTATDFSAAHGLNLSTFIRVTFTMEWEKSIVEICTLSGIYRHVHTYPTLQENYGRGYVQTVSPAELSEVKLGWYSKALTSPIWFIGDSMMSLYPERWPYQMVTEFNRRDILVDALAGGGSDTLLSDLQRLLDLGSPRFLFWGLGGNDNPWVWMNVVTQVEMLCRERGITLILNRIPWRTDIPNGSKADQNTYVVNSGYRYVDTYRAVSSDESGTWYPGYCADGVHPTQLGAKAIATQFLVDMPELTI